MRAALTIAVACSLGALPGCSDNGASGGTTGRSSATGTSSAAATNSSIGSSTGTTGSGTTARGTTGATTSGGSGSTGTGTPGAGSTGGTSTGGLGGTSGASDGGPVTFVPLHTYFLSPTGSDSNSGTSANEAWATPKHSVQCGDVIIAAAGSYSNAQFGLENWGTVSGCPSDSGGIDGTGGVYFATLLCAGPDLASCTVNGGNAEAFRVDSSNWAVEGFAATQSQSSQNSVGCFSATSEVTTTQHHIAFINNIASDCMLAGFDSYAWTSPGGVDQTAVVGAIAYNAAPSTDNGGLCGSGVSLIPSNGPDTSPGTHVFVAGYFGYDNINAATGAGCNTDGEGLIFDSWSCSSYRYQGVAEQNVWWHNGSSGFEVFPNCLANLDRVQVYAFGNTSYGNDQDPLHAGGSSELILNQLLPQSGTIYSVTDNIFEATVATSGDNGTTPVVAAAVSVNNTDTQPVTVAGNYFWQSDPGTQTGPGTPNTQAYVNGAENTATFPFGTNSYDSPGFANPAALPSTEPECSGYANTTACMNEQYEVASDLAPSGAAVGIGYQPPGPCGADPYFPSWLKGVVYLSWDGTKVTENPGLITKPCGL